MTFGIIANMRLRTAGPDDLDFILEQEARPEFAVYLYAQGREKHEAGLADPDKRYVMVEDEQGTALGYFIFAGLAAPYRIVELVRVAIAQPGQGLGSQALRLALDLAFGEFAAHRLWLDVDVDNHRARHVYRTLGFVEEGLLRDGAFLDGVYRPLVIMSMLEEEYRAVRDSR